MAQGGEVAANPAGKKRSTAEAALLATVEDLRRTIRGLRAEIATLRKSAPTQKQAKTARTESPERQRVRRPSAPSTPKKTQQTQLAQAAAKPSYATVAQGAARKTRTQTTVVAKRETWQTGTPLQPVAEELQRTAEKEGYGTVLPAHPYRDRDLVDTGMTQLALTTPPAQWPHTLKEVLLVGKSREDSWAVALEALVAHKGIQEIAAIVNLGHAHAAPAIAGLRKLPGWTREELALLGAHLSITATSRSS